MAYEEQLDAFRYNLGIRTKGSLAVVVQLTRAFSEDTLPIDPSDYRTKKNGQVAGLGEANLKKILGQHGIYRTLAKEAGRTSRGSMGLMEGYAELINELPRPVDFAEIEAYWIRCVREFFSEMPFKLSGDSSRSVGAAIDNLLAQAVDRQKSNPGTQYAGSVLQHLVAAKLQLVLGDIEVYGASVADDQTSREGDFVVSDTAIHCTTAPANLLIEKCKSNLANGYRPVIVTVGARVGPAIALLEDEGIGDRVEVWGIQQFLSVNVFEHGLFDSTARSDFLGKLIESYNAIVDICETDPSLRIEYRA